jgi:hypothetical protein
VERTEVEHRVAGHEDGLGDHEEQHALPVLDVCRETKIKREV